MTTSWTTRPPLSPAAQAVLEQARGRRWETYDAGHGLTCVANRHGHVCECTESPEPAAEAEAIVHAVNHHARDRERGGGAMSLYDTMAASHPKLQRGRVWCHRCGATRDVRSAVCLQSGWPRCCGETMSIDSPEERKALGTEA